MTCLQWHLVTHFYKRWLTVQFPCKDTLLKILFVYFFRERGREGEREAKKHQCAVASLTPQAYALTESNRWPLGLQDGTQSTEPHQLEQDFLIDNLEPCAVSCQGNDIFKCAVHEKAEVTDQIKKKKHKSKQTSCKKMWDIN